MSLINETINNLQEKNKNKNKQRINIHKKALFFLILFGAAITGFLGAHFFDLSKYYEISRNFFHFPKTWVITSTNNENQTSLPFAAQGQYYNAVNLLNEGNVKQATHDLKNILEKYPNFAPAQKLYNLLEEE